MTKCRKTFFYSEQCFAAYIETNYTVSPLKTYYFMV